MWASRTWLIKWSHRQIHLLYKFSSSLSAVPLNCGDVYDFISTLKLNLILPFLKVSVRSWNMSQYNCPSGSLCGVYLQPWHTGCLCPYTDSCWMKTDCPIAKQNSTKSWNLRWCLKSFIPVYNLEWKAGFVLSLMKTGSDVCKSRGKRHREQCSSREWSGDSAHETNRTVNQLVELLALTEPEWYTSFVCLVSTCVIPYSLQNTCNL